MGKAFNVEVPMAAESPFSREAFTTAYWWGSRLRHKEKAHNPFPDGVDLALRRDELDIADALEVGVGLFDELAALEWACAALDERRIRAFENWLASMVAGKLAADSTVLIQNKLEPGALLVAAAEHSGWDSGVTIFEPGAATLTLPGMVMAVLGGSQEVVPIQLMTEYPDSGSIF